MIVRKKLIYLILCSVLYSGCAQVTSLNLKKHRFGRIPTKIIWLQVAGITPEHIAMLKYTGESVKYVTAFEKSTCMGSTWSYDLYNLRSNAYDGFMAQLVGSKNIKGTCEDYKRKPIWKYLNNQGYKIGIFEGETKKSTNSLLAAIECSDHKDYLKGTTVWKMSQNKKTEDLFHVNETPNFKTNKTYYDKSCLSGECYTTFARNVEGVYKNFKKNTKNSLFLVRNFTFLEKLKAKKYKDAREELNQINLILNYFEDEVQKDNNTLVLLTSSEAIDIDMPKTGKEWKEYEKSGRYLNLKKSNLAASVFASGARAENFCGLYDQSEILPRIFSGSKQQGLEFSIINPFD